MYSGSTRLSKVRLAKCRVFLLFRDVLVKCFTHETGRPCSWHCSSRHGSISLLRLNSAPGTRTVAIVEFMRRSLDVVTLLLHSWLIFSNSSELVLVLASTKMVPSARRIHVNSSFNFLCSSDHIFIPLGFGVLSSSNCKTWNLVHVSQFVPTR